VKQTEQSHSLEAGFKKPLDLPETVDVVATYEAMLQLMQPGETVARAIKRLGGRDTGGKSAASVQRRQAWKDKKAQQMDTSSTSAEVNKTDDSGNRPEKNDLLDLIGCADKLLSFNGEMGIYQDTFEKLSFKVKSASETGVAASRPVDDGLDMFADDVTTKPAAAVGVQKTATNSHEKGNCYLAIASEVMFLPHDAMLKHNLCRHVVSVLLPHDAMLKHNLCRHVVFIPLPHDAMLKHNLCRHVVSVRPSVHLAVCHIRVLCQNKYSYPQTFFTVM